MPLHLPEMSWAKAAKEKNKIENVLTDLDMLIDQKQAKVTFTALPSMMGIPVQLHQLFANLIDNSIKYTNQQTNQSLRDSRVAVSREM